MIDPILTPSFFLHIFLLLTFWVWGAKQMALPMREWPFVTFFGVWTTFILTGHLSGIGKHLGDLKYYVSLTIICAIGLFALLSFLSKVPSRAALVRLPDLAYDVVGNKTFEQRLIWFLGITLCLVALASFVLVLCVYPDNADSMIYRLPRAFWYVSNGSFMHPFESVDKRLVFYPLNGVALYIPFVLYGVPGNLQGLPSFICWLMVVYTTYGFARSLGAQRWAGLLSAWIVGLTPSILAQATSTNDEILAGSALLVGLYMGWRFLLTGRGYYFVVAGSFVAISAGTKLHIVFLLPIIFVLLVMAFWFLYRNPKDRHLWLGSVSATCIASTAMLMALLFLPFLFYNYGSSGRFYFLNDFKGDVFNLRASLQGGFQNLLIYVSQMVLSPIADLNFWPVANDRQAFNHALNKIFYPLLSSLIDRSAQFYHMDYRFVGITLPVSVRFVEFSLWSAFVWLLWPWQSALIFKRKEFSFAKVFFIVALLPAFWLILWSFGTLYMEGTATYFSFYLIVAAPAMSLTMLSVKGQRLREFKQICIGLVVFSNLIIAHNLVMYSGFRALPDLIFARKLPFDWLLTEEPIINEIRRSPRIRIAFTHEKQPYFAYMHWNPRAQFLSPYRPDANELTADTLHILPISSLYRYGFAPLAIPHKRNPGVTYLGLVRGIGREAIFAVGNDVYKRYPDVSNYIILGSSFAKRADGQYSISFGEDPAGLSVDDHLSFEYTLRRDQNILFYRKAESSPNFKYYTPVLPYEDHLVLDITVWDDLSGKPLLHSTYGIGGSGAWLPEGGEY